MKALNRKEQRARRHRRIRRKVAGTTDRPRMAIAMSNKNMTVQFIDDEQGHTLAAATSLRSDEANNLEGATALGRRAAEAAQAKGISRVVVDRGGSRYHGRVKAIVESAMKAGLTTSTKEAT